MAAIDPKDYDRGAAALRTRREASLAADKRLTKGLQDGQPVGTSGVTPRQETHARNAKR